MEWDKDGGVLFIVSLTKVTLWSEFFTWFQSDKDLIKWKDLFNLPLHSSLTVGVHINNIIWVDKNKWTNPPLWSNAVVLTIEMHRDNNNNYDGMTMPRQSREPWMKPATIRPPVGTKADFISGWIIMCGGDSASDHSSDCVWIIRLFFVLTTRIVSCTLQQIESVFYYPCMHVVSYCC